MSYLTYQWMSNMKKRLILFLIAVAAQACTSLAVKGQLQNSMETFTGSVSNDINGSGLLKLISTTGAVCEGLVDYFEYEHGRGVLNCDDGRKGLFELQASGSSGTGHGSLGSEQFNFSFGF